MRCCSESTRRRFLPFRESGHQLRAPRTATVHLCTPGVGSSILQGLAVNGRALRGRFPQPTHVAGTLPAAPPEEAGRPRGLGGSLRRELLPSLRAGNCRAGRSTGCTLLHEARINGVRCLIESHSMIILKSWNQPLPRKT
jgi:hypothetical protein